MKHTMTSAQPTEHKSTISGNARTSHRGHCGCGNLAKRIIFLLRNGRGGRPQLTLPGEEGVQQFQALASLKRHLHQMRPTDRSIQRADGADRQADRQDRQTDRQTDRQDRQKDRQTDRQDDRQACRHTKQSRHGIAAWA